MSAGIEFRARCAGFADALWFRFPRSQEAMVSRRADGFLACALPLAMRQGEELIVEGEVSPRLLEGIGAYQQLFASWFPRRFRAVEVHCERISEAPAPGAPGSVVCAFSGGVDSFFSLQRHLPAAGADPAARVTHGLFVHGFDLELEESGRYQRYLRSYAGLFESLDLTLLSASTNIQQFDTRSFWGHFNGAALIGLMHVLGTGCSRFYVPASHTLGSLVPWGSDPRLDPLLSTESLEVVHDGAELRRVEKIAAISSWRETYDRLRVCVRKTESLNCCRCEKCLRTMLSLDMGGVLERYSSFQEPVDLGRVRRCRYFNASDYTFAHELLGQALRAGRWGIVGSLLWAILASRAGQAWRWARRRL